MTHTWFCELLDAVEDLKEFYSVCKKNMQISTDSFFQRHLPLGTDESCSLELLLHHLNNPTVSTYVVLSSDVSPVIQLGTTAISGLSVRLSNS